MDEPLNNDQWIVRNIQQGKFLSERLPKHMYREVYRAIGRAAVCWDHPEKAGRFHYKEADALAFNLCRFIADEIEVFSS